MGLYDRDYYQEPRRPGLTLRTPRTMVGILVLINVVLYAVDGLFFAERHQLTAMLAVHNDTWRYPWMWWQFLTYGFAHDVSPTHVLFNMLQLWFLGRTVEQVYGAKEFLRFYLVTIVLGSVVWCATFNLLGDHPRGMLIGASGAVSGVVLLFVLNFPRQTLMLFPIPIPIKAWVIGVLLVVGNLYGAMAEMGNVAFGVHLTGLAFAALYFQGKWNLGRLTDRMFSVVNFKRQPKLRIHDPQAKQADAGNLTEQVDRILEKIHREGEGSLTRKERKLLESASREYQKRQQ